MELIIPDELVAEVAWQNSIAFIGAALSAALELQTWPQLVPIVIKWCEKHGVGLPTKLTLNSFSR